MFIHRRGAGRRACCPNCRAGFRACRLRSFPTSPAKADSLTRNPGTGKSPEPADRNVCPTSEAEIDLGNSGAPISDPARFCWNRNPPGRIPLRQSILRSEAASEDRGYAEQGPVVAGLCPGKPALRGSGRMRPLQAKHFLELAFDLLLSFPTDGALGRVKPRFGK